MTKLESAAKSFRQSVAAFKAASDAERETWSEGGDREAQPRADLILKHAQSVCAIAKYDLIAAALKDEA